MKTERLQDALGLVREDYVLDAHSEKKTMKKPWLRWGALAACLCLIAVCAFGVPKLLHRNAPAPDPAPGTEPDPPGPNTVIIEPEPGPDEPVSWPAVFNQVDTAPDSSFYVSLTGRPLTAAERAAVIPEDLLAGLELKSAFANFGGYTDETSRIQPEDAQLDCVELELTVLHSGRTVHVGMWPEGQNSHIAWAAQFDPAAYEATPFLTKDVTLFRYDDPYGVYLWTYFSFGGVSYSVSAEGEEAKDDFCAVINDILMSVTTPDLSIIVPNP